MHAYLNRARRALATAVALMTAAAAFIPAPQAHAVAGEGTIKYDSRDATPNLDPSSHVGPGRGISGSKTAAPLDANDQSNITVTLPGSGAGDFDIVLVIDGTKGLAEAGPAAGQMLLDLADDLETRPGANINVGIVGYGTVGYTRFARPGEIFGLQSYQKFVKMVKDGTLSGTNIGGYQSLLDYLPPLPEFPKGALTAEGTVETHRYLLGDESGLAHLTTDNVKGLYDTAHINGANFAIQAMMVHAASVPVDDPAHSLQLTHRFIIHDAVVGTNLEAGIKAGQAQLATGSAPAGNKLLIVVSDAGTYFWNDPTNTPSQSMSGGVHDSTDSIAWGQKEGDWNTGHLASGNFDNYADFLANTDVTTSTKSRLSIADYHAFAKNHASYDPSVLTRDVADRTRYPYVSLEKGMAHAAVALQNVVKENPGERVMLLGSGFEPSRGTGPGSVYDMSQKWQQWASKVVARYVDIETATSASISEALAGVRKQLWYPTVQAKLYDTFGPEFRLVTSKHLANTDVKVAIGGQPVPGVIDTNDANTINYGEADENGVYPYVAHYEPGRLHLDINVPIETVKPLQLHYALQLVRDTSVPGWHEDVPLSVGPELEYLDSDGKDNTTTFPVALTRYFMPYFVIYDQQYEDDYGPVYYFETGDNWSDERDGTPNLWVGDDETIPNPQVIRGGYEFVGWFLDPEGTKTWDFSKPVTENLRFYAQWRPVEVRPELPASEPSAPEPQSPPSAPVDAGGRLAGDVVAWMAAAMLTVGVAAGVAFARRRQLAVTK